jgi:hypothetical protein
MTNLILSIVEKMKNGCITAVLKNPQATVVNTYIFAILMIAKFHVTWVLPFILCSLSFLILRLEYLFLEEIKKDFEIE